MALGGDGNQPGGIGLEGLALDGFDSGGEPAIGIGYRNADGLGAQIEPDQRAALRPVRNGVDQRQDEGWHGLAYHARRRSRKAVAP